LLTLSLPLFPTQPGDGLAHRDGKLDNLLISEDMLLWIIIDWGLSQGLSLADMEDYLDACTPSECPAVV
jgi:serine/threonine protein kinase